MQFLFGDCALDADRRELRRGADLVQVEPQVFDLLVHLLRNRDRVVSKDDLVAAVWQGRTVSDSTLSTRITAARRAIGDSGETQQLIRTVARRGVRFVGDVREEAAGAASSPSTPVRPSPNRAPHQDVTFCRTADGVSLAVATSGSGPPLVKASHWLNHIEHEWQSPVWSPLFVRLAAKSRLIRYDGRATGLSDYNVSDLSFDACVRDLETVVDALGLQRFALLGIAQGAPVSVAYAARHPERVSRLMLYGGFALGWLRWPTFSDPVGPASREAIVALMRDGWIPNNPGFRRFFNLLFVPDASEVELNWLDDLQRAWGLPENLTRLFMTFAEFDLGDLLPRVTAPTLVLHSRGEMPIPLEQGRILAQGIPGARFVALDSNNHLILSREPAWQRLVDEICGFLDEADEICVSASRRHETEAHHP